MKLAFTYTPEDLKELSHATRTQPMPFMRGLLGWAVFILACVAVVFVLARQRNANPAPVAPAAGPAALTSMLIASSPWFIAFFFIWFFVFRSFRAHQRTYDQNAELQQPQTLELTDHAVVLADPVARTEFRWEGLDELVESPKAFLLRRHINKSYIIIPKRAATAEQVEQMRVIFQSRIGKSGAFPVLPTQRG